MMNRSNSNIILRIALNTPLRRFFDYLPPQDIDIKQLIPGLRVKVPFQSRTLVGILMSIEKSSSLPYGKLKRAEEVLDSEILFTPDVFQLCEFAANYYQAPIGELLLGALPKVLRQGKEFAGTSSAVVPAKAGTQTTSPIPLNAAQQQAVSTILQHQNQFKTFLLDGVTGSGKTEVYLQVIAEMLKQQKQTLVLVPEISLTPQTIARFQSRFAVPIHAWHSGLTEKEKLNTWIAAKNNTAKIIIGTRSAIFTPFTNLGLIVVDEEHDASFKQQDRLRFHARDLAVKRANLNNIPIVLGSATPSLESILNVQRKRYKHLVLPQRAGNSQLPCYQLIDLRQEKKQNTISAVLIDEIKKHLEKNNQVLLFLNRRGFAPVLYCTNCAFIPECKRCSVRLVYHKNPDRLRCHHCDFKSAIPIRCIKCGENKLQAVGLGTQRIEEIIQEYFPTISIIRIDRDNTRKKAGLQKLLNEINAQEKAILIGTQMLAKGHHFPRVTLVGIIDADNGFLSADFRAIEQIGQLIVQVAGRAGRDEQPGTVCIQTHHPENRLLQLLIQKGYAEFAQTLLRERELTLLPPFSYFAIFSAESVHEQNAQDFLRMLIQIKNEENVEMLGPVASALAKRKGLYSQQLLLKASSRSALQQFLKKCLQQIENIKLSAVKWVLDVDPIEN